MGLDYPIAYPILWFSAQKSLNFPLFQDVPLTFRHVLNVFCNVCSLLNVGTSGRIVDSLQRRRRDKRKLRWVLLIRNPFIKHTHSSDAIKLVSVSIFSEVYKYHVSFIYGLLSSFCFILTHEYSLWSFACKSSLQKSKVKQCEDTSECIKKNIYAYVCIRVYLPLPAN